VYPLWENSLRNGFSDEAAVASIKSGPHTRGVYYIVKVLDAFIENSDSYDKELVEFGLKLAEENTD